MFKRSGVWWTCIRYKSKKIQKSLETSDKRLAQNIEAKIRTEIVEGKYFDKLPGQNKNFKDMMDRLMSEHALTVTDNMHRSYTTSRKNLEFFFKDYSLTAITSKEISRYKVTRRKKVKPATVNRELAMLSKAFSLAVKEWEWLERNPVSNVKKETENNERDRWLSNEEEKSLLAHCPDWLRDIIVFSENTGLRQGELISLEWPQVDLFRKTVLIKDTKNKKPRTIPLNKKAIDILLKKSKVRSISCKTVFLNPSRNKIDASKLRKELGAVLIKAGIENFRFHDLRHTFATRLAQAGADIYRIAKLLGHKDIRMTQRYAHHCPDSLRGDVDLLQNFNNFDYNLTTMTGKKSVHIS